MAYAFWGSSPNLNQAVNRLNRQNFNLSGVIGNITGGNGQHASDEQIEAAVQWLINKASNNYITYSQTNRNLKNPSGMSFDCSSFIITGFYAVGIDINATSTSDMRGGFTAAGWTWIDGMTWESSQLLRGDILLDEATHTQMYIGDNQDVNCGSTPAKVIPHSVNNFGRGWDGILRKL